MSTVLTTSPSTGHSANAVTEAGQKVRKRILVVDDDAGILSSLGRLLDVLDVDVDKCADPREAMTRVEATTYDLVISDERMPGMSGLDMLRQIRSCSPRTPTILMTAYNNPGEFNRAYESCGVFRYLTKPWDNFDFIVTVREALRAAEAVN